MARMTQKKPHTTLVSSSAPSATPAVQI
jgi:hypothetical protein